MALLTPTVIASNSGLLDLLGALVAATSGGDSFFCTGREWFYANNGSASAITVTFSTAATGANVQDNFGIVNAAHDGVFTVAAGKILAVPGVWPLRFKDSNGNAQVRYSAVTSLTVGVVLGNVYY